MTELNEHRALVSLLREICGERNVRLSEFSDTWVLCLQQGRRTAYVFGYDFGLNSATATMIAKDKAATSDLLAFHGVARIEHRIFHSPQLVDYVPPNGNWLAMIEYFKAHAGDVVCKPNEGTGGLDVYRVRSLLELEKVVLELFRQYRAICFSPFEEITAEYRVAVLRGRCEFLYRKDRPVVVGDGRCTVGELLGTWIGQQPHSAMLGCLSADAHALSKHLLNRRPAAGEAVELNWRHNLGQGAAPVLLDLATPHAQSIANLALLTARVLGIELASVDVVEIDGRLVVLEVNSGIMMERFARITPENWEIAKRFYEKIISALME